jgi:hypothetical protein
VVYPGAPMADDSPSPAEPPPCAPCRGTGRLVSRLGGTAHEVVCPWCAGTGRFIPGRDAQDEPAEAQDAGGGAGEPAGGGAGGGEPDPSGS